MDYYLLKSKSFQLPQFNKSKIHHQITTSCSQVTTNLAKYKLFIHKILIFSSWIIIILHINARIQKKKVLVLGSKSNLFFDSLKTWVRKESKQADEEQESNLKKSLQFRRAIHFSKPETQNQNLKNPNGVLNDPICGRGKFIEKRRLSFHGLGK